ncbi:MAG: cation:proton antiporter, partial [Ilumatobacteraceae bacterium]
MDFVKFVAPSGPQWELLVAVAVVLVAPVIVERLRLPGMVGLLFGGMAIGPNVLDVVAADTGVVAEVGGLGLLYLMFMAGLDLDLNVFAKLRRHALLFAGLTFVVPFALGVVIGFAVGYGSGAALLLGAVFASHTLVTYPIVRGYGLSTNNAVAITVGATVITDTLALIVLAVVSGQASGNVTGWELASQLAIGLAVLGVACFVVMPIAGRWYFAKIGRTRVARYTFLLGVLLAGAVVATAVGIEPIVGAFFAGLAINRLVPSESEMMERIEFFGSAVLIPIFLVAVGTIIDPVQLVSVGTLGLAALFALAAVGGKAVAALIARFAFGLSWSEAGTMFSLSVSRAAATLAATIVGLNLGLFDTSTANAIMLVIVVSLVASSITATAFGSRVPRPVIEVERVGRSVLVQVAIEDDHEALTAVAARLARVDGGVVRPVYVVSPGAEVPTSARVRAIDRRIAGLGVDASLDVRHDRSLEDGLANAAASAESSLIIVDDSGAAVARSAPGAR